MPAHPVPTVFMMSNPLKTAGGQQRHHGVACVTARDFRWERGDIKSTPACWAMCWRGRSRPTTAPLRPSCSATASSPKRLPAMCGSRTKARCWARPRANTCWKASAWNCCASSCEDCGIASNLRPITEADVRAADEVMLSSATKEILPVTRIDGEEVGHGAMRGEPGPVYAHLYEAYQRAKLRIGL